MFRMYLATILDIDDPSRTETGFFLKSRKLSLRMIRFAEGFLPSRCFWSALLIELFCPSSGTDSLYGRYPLEEGFVSCFWFFIQRMALCSRRNDIQTACFDPLQLPEKPADGLCTILYSRFFKLMVGAPNSAQIIDRFIGSSLFGH